MCYLIKEVPRIESLTSQTTMAALFSHPCCLPMPLISIDWWIGWWAGQLHLDVENQRPPSCWETASTPAKQSRHENRQTGTRQSSGKSSAWKNWVSKYLRRRQHSFAWTSLYKSNLPDNARHRPGRKFRKNDVVYRKSWWVGKKWIEIKLHAWKNGHDMNDSTRMTWNERIENAWIDMRELEWMKWNEGTQMNECHEWSEMKEWNE